MLVLSRKKSESIVIGHGIEVTVVEVRGNVVRLGVKAPASVPVHRDEVRRRIDREAMASSRKEPRAKSASRPQDDDYVCPSTLEQTRAGAAKSPRTGATSF